MPAKPCKTCGVEKSLSDFNQHRPGEHRGECRACWNASRTKHGKIRTAADVPPGARSPHIVAPPPTRVVPEPITQIEEHRLKRRVRELEEQRQELLKQLDEGSTYNEVLREARALGPERPSIQPRERKSKLLEGTPLFLASDWHVEQEVKPEAVAGRNRYNLEIAKRRMQRFFEAMVWVIRQQSDTYKIRDFILWLGGDFIQNFLHEDDVENNLLPPLAAIRFWTANTIEGIQFVLDSCPEIEQGLVPMNDGNHARLTKKMRSSTRQDHSLETFAYAQIALHFRHEKRLKFILPTSQFTYLDDVYGRTIRFLHGDVFKFGGGIGGITVPMFRAMSRWEKTKHADLTCLGHWHQRYCLPDCMVNSSLIGFDSYAMGIGAAFEAPSQSARMLDSRRWSSADIPMWVSEVGDDALWNKRPS